MSERLVMRREAVSRKREPLVPILCYGHFSFGRATRDQTRSWGDVPQPPHSLPGVVGDLFPAFADVRHRLEDEGLADFQPDLPRARKAGDGWECTEGSAQVTGDDGNGRAGGEHAEPRLERLERSVS